MIPFIGYTDTLLLPLKNNLVDNAGQGVFPLTEAGHPDGACMVCASALKTSRTAGPMSLDLIRQDHFRSLFRNHDGRCVSVARRDGWHHRGVDDP